MEIMEDRIGVGEIQLGLSKCRRKVIFFSRVVCTRFHLFDLRFSANSDAMRLAPNSPDVLTTRGLVLFLSGKLPQALQHLQSALRLDPGHDSALQLRRRIKDVERLKEEGNQAFKVGSLQDAIEKYDASLEVCMPYHLVFVRDPCSSNCIFQRIGSKEEEGKGGQIRATLLSNRATTLIKAGF